MGCPQSGGERLRSRGQRRELLAESTEALSTCAIKRLHLLVHLLERVGEGLDRAVQLRPGKLEEGLVGLAVGLGGDGLERVPYPVVQAVLGRRQLRSRDGKLPFGFTQLRARLVSLPEDRAQQHEDGASAEQKACHECQSDRHGRRRVDPRPDGSGAAEA